MSSLTAPTPSNGNGSARPAARASRRSGKPQHMNGPLYKQANSNVVLVRRLKRKNEGPMKQLTRWFVNNQIGAFEAPIAAPAYHRTNKLT